METVKMVVFMAVVIVAMTTEIGAYNIQRQADKLELVALPTNRPLSNQPITLRCSWRTSTSRGLNDVTTSHVTCSYRWNFLCDNNTDYNLTGQWWAIEDEISTVSIYGMNEYREGWYTCVYDCGMYRLQESIHISMRHGEDSQWTSAWELATLSLVALTAVLTTIAVYFAIRLGRRRAAIARGLQRTRDIDGVAQRIFNPSGFKPLILPPYSPSDDVPPGYDMGGHCSCPEQALGCWRPTEAPPGYTGEENISCGLVHDSSSWYNSRPPSYHSQENVMHFENA